MKRSGKNTLLKLVLFAVVFIGLMNVNISAAGLVSLWKFDDGAGAIAIDSEDDNDGTVSGASWTYGRVASALSFDGTDDYVDCGSDFSLNTGTSDFSISMWVKYSSAGTTYFDAFLTKGNPSTWTTAGSRGYALGIDSAGKIIAFIWRGDDSWIRSATSPLAYNDGKWHHVAVVFDRDDYLKLYIDGGYVAQGDISTNQSSIDSNASVIIGKRSVTYTCCTIDEAKIYDGILSSDDIYAEYSRENVVAHWTFDEGINSTAVDSAGDNDASVSGATWACGRVLGALELDGTDDYVDCGNDSSLNMGTSDFTLAAWVKYTDAGSSWFNAFLTKGNPSTWTTAGSRGYAIGADANGKITVFIWRGDDSWYKSVTSVAAYDDGKWHHIAAVFDRDDYLKLYIDGVYVAQSDISSNQSSIDSTASLWLGRRSVTYSGCAIDDVKIYGNVLTSDFIDDLAGIGNTYYMDATSGDDDNDGLSAATAWQTIGKINQNDGTLQSGDTVLFKRGEVFKGYTLDVFTDTLTFDAYGSGDRPVIDGEGVRRPFYHLGNGDPHNTTFRNIKFFHPYVGVQNTNEGYCFGSWYMAYLTIDNCVFDGNDNAYSCAYIGGLDRANFTVIKNSVFTNAYTEHGLYINVDNLLVENCEFSNNNGNGLKFNSDTILVHPVIRYNWFENNHWAGFAPRGADDVEFYNNVVITLDDSTRGSTAVRVISDGVDGKIHHNTFIMTGSGGTEVRLGVWIYGTDGGDGWEITNNIFYMPEAIPDPKESFYIIRNSEASSDQVIEDNLYYGYTGSGTGTHQWRLDGVYYDSFSEWQTAGYDDDGVFADPLFVDFSNNDFRLQANSPAIALDAGAYQ